MVKKYTIAEGRDKFTSMVHEAEQGTQVELTRRGKPVAVLIRVEDFQRLSKGAPTFAEAYEGFRREFDLAALDIDPAVLFAGVRESSPGRDFDW